MDITAKHQRSFGKVKLLAGAYLGVSAVTLAVIVLLRDHASVVNSAVWVRGSIVAASALVTYVLALRASQGSHGAYRRLRIISAAMVVAIVVIIALPGTFPLWLKAEQGVCGLILLGVAVIVNGSHMRSLFAGK